MHDMTYQAVMEQLKITREWDLFNRLTNNRDFNGSDIDAHKDTVLNGYNKIINLIKRRR